MSYTSNFYELVSSSLLADAIALDGTTGAIPRLKVVNKGQKAGKNVG